MTELAIVTSTEMSDPEYRLDLPNHWTGVVWHHGHGDFAECRECVENNPCGSGDSIVSGTLASWPLVCDHGHEDDEEE